MVYERTGRLDRAELHYREAYRLDSRNPRFLLALTKLQAQTGSVDAAIELLNRDISQRPRPVVVRLWMTLMMELGKFDKVEHQLSDFVEKYPEHIVAWQHFLAILALSPNVKEARARLYEALRQTLDVKSERRSGGK